MTIASSASAIVQQIIANPTGITTLLAKRLPTVSNFYISYFIVQGLSLASGVLAQVVGFVIFRIMYKYLAGTPRKMYMKWANLSAISWGSTLPVFTNIVVIGKLIIPFPQILLISERHHLLLYRSFDVGICDNRIIPFLPRIQIQCTLCDRQPN